MSIRITGELVSDAELRYTAGKEPHALLLMTLKGGKGFPFSVAQDYGTQPIQHLAAQAKLRLLRRGTTVTVSAAGITPRTDHGHAVLKLEDVADVFPSSSTDHNHRPGSNHD